MRIFTAILATFTSLLLSLGLAQAASAPAQPIVAQNAPESVWQADRFDPIKPIRFRHGDVSWLPSLAKQAGWPEKAIPQLTQIVLRESGGCPNRRGGDMVDKDCNITGVSEWNHRSDTGLLQINGVNYDLSRNKWAAVCREMNICTQEPLLDPLTNLKAGLVLYNLSGFEPWNPCNWRVCKASTTSVP
jgi:hypothetical protein